MNEQWESVTLRMKLEAKKTLQNNTDGLAIVTAHMVVDASGNPIVWVVPGGKRVEPSKNAKQILMNLLAS